MQRESYQKWKVGWSSLLVPSEYIRPFATWICNLPISVQKYDPPLSSLPCMTYLFQEVQCTFFVECLTSPKVIFVYGTYQRSYAYMTDPSMTILGPNPIPANQDKWWYCNVWVCTTNIEQQDHYMRVIHIDNLKRLTWRLSPFNHSAMKPSVRHRHRFLIGGAWSVINRTK